MLDSMHRPPEGFKQILHWYEKAQIDYTVAFLRLYIAYNTWYTEVTCTTNDREALNRLKKRSVIWEDYCDNRTLYALKSYMERLVDVTHKEPLSGGGYWNGEIASVYDWRSLIECWYRVRCRIVHGGRVATQYAWLAYETLNIFMGEILRRVEGVLASFDMEKLRRVSQKVANSTLSQSPSSRRHRDLQQRLYQKYTLAPDIWQVDMQRVL